ncbi:MAG: ABC transporter permease [Deltaproteobacteria bacterium]|nr:ABC transporter permease [Deltaproteobacteria bacterium]
MRRVLLPLVTGGALLAIWAIASAADAFPTGTVPSPAEVARAFADALVSGELLEDAISSLYRVAWGFVGATITAVPLGLLIGRSLTTRAALLPWINFFRSLSPIAWIPFAIVWFGIGDPPAIFLIFIATFFQLVVATAAAAAAVPEVYYRVARDLGYDRNATLFDVTLNAILPQLLTALRIAIGVAWMVVVAAEMIAVQSGLGFLIGDARNGMRTDRVVVGMIAIGLIGIGLDLAFARLARHPSLRWGSAR